MSAPGSEGKGAALTAWWEAAGEGRLLVERCRTCMSTQHYPRGFCTSCASREVEQVPASGNATLYSFTEIHRSPTPAFTAPYVIGLVRLEEGPMLMCRVVPGPDGGVACDLRGTVAWTDIEGRQLLRFVPTGSPATDYLPLLED
jgi:uncharacterized OB-fold protein